MPVVNQFPTKQYDVTNLIAKACSCCILTEQLTLEPEEVVFRRGTLCDTYTRRLPYGELGSVDKNTSCGCCSQTMLKDVPIVPGLGCESGLVEEIVAELKARMKERGDTGNIQRAEMQIDMITSMQGEMKDLQGKLDLVIKHLGIPAPANMAR